MLVPLALLAKALMCQKRCANRNLGMPHARKKPVRCRCRLAAGTARTTGPVDSGCIRYLPAQARDPKAEYNAAHIPGAVFFDQDLVVDPDLDLPHTLPKPPLFAQHAGSMGISVDDTIVVYDGPGMFTAPRVWLDVSRHGGAAEGLYPRRRFRQLEKSRASGYRRKTHEDRAVRLSYGF